MRQPGKSRYGEAFSLAPLMLSDPCDDCSAWITVRWTPALDKRVRIPHGHNVSIIRDEFFTVEPPSCIAQGMYNCRGEYVVRHLWSEWGDWKPIERVFTPTFDHVNHRPVKLPIARRERFCVRCNVRDVEEL